MSQGKFSWLDLTLVSENLAGKCDWKLINQNTVGSDHFPIRSTIGIDIAQTGMERVPRWKFKSADWEKYKELSHNRMSEFENIMEDVETFNYKICEVLRSTAEEVIGKKKAGNRKKAVPWWNEECSEAISNRNKALKRVRRSCNYNDFIRYKRTQAIVRRVIRMSKRKYWREFCSNIGEDININEVWSMIRKMGGKQRSNNIPVLVYKGNLVMLDSGKADALAETFALVHSNSNLSEEMRKHREQMSENPQLLEEKGPSGCTLDSEFTLCELKKALAVVKQTSPGRDDICYEMVKHLSEYSIYYFEPI